MDVESGFQRNRYQQPPVQSAPVNPFPQLPTVTFFVIFFLLSRGSSFFFWFCISVCLTITLLRFYLLYYQRRRFSIAAHLSRDWTLTDINPLNLQLTFIDRDFNENDYEMLLHLDSNTVSTTGASCVDIESLPTHRVSAEEITNDDDPQNDYKKFQSCSICLENCRSEEVFKSLPCQHNFHVECIDNWLKIKSICPICKVQAFPSKQK